MIVQFMAAAMSMMSPRMAQLLSAAWPTLSVPATASRMFAPSAAKS
jgi:hypothetical protein